MNNNIKKEIILKCALYPDTSDINVEKLDDAYHIKWDGNVESLSLWHKTFKEDNRFRSDIKEILGFISQKDLFDQLYFTNVNGILIEDGLEPLLYFKKDDRIGHIHNSDTITIDLAEFENMVEIVQKVENNMNKKALKWSIISCISTVSLVYVFSLWNTKYTK